MKRLVAVFIILLSIIFIAHAQNNKRAGLAAAVVPVSQKEISAKLKELDTRVAALQTNLDWSNALLQQRGQAQ